MKMSRKLQVLALAMLSVLAMGATAASAQAGEFTAAEYPATVTGLQVVPHELTTELGVMECGAKFHGELSEASEELTLTPGYGTSCQIAGLQVHVNTNGCDYRFHAGNTLGMDEVEGSWDVICPEGNKIDFEITGVMAVCHLVIPEQLGLGEVTYTDKTMAMPKDVNVHLNVEGLAYETGNNCPVVGAFENGSYSGTSTLRADDEGGMPIPFVVE
jgi:hypothetical protein